MSMIIKNNIEALKVINLMDQNQSALQKDLNKVTTGMKINTAADDASPWAISERMRMRIRALDQDYQNIQNDSALMKTAEGAVSNTIEILKTLKERAINAANDSNTDEDRATIQKEIDQFIDQIDDNALVQFNGKYLVDGSKNHAVISSKTILLNQSLSTGTQAASALTDLANRAGDMLEIHSDDKYQVSWVNNGVTATTSGVVGGVTLTDLLTIPTDSNDAQLGVISELATGNVFDATVKTKYDTDIYTPDRTAAIAFVANKAGVTSQIAGFTISITDAQGNIKKAANSSLDQFKLMQRAENQTGDKSLTFHSGPEANVAMKVALGDMRAEALGLKGSNNDKVSVRTKEDANSTINAIENALTMSLDEQITIGAVLSRLEYTVTNILTARDNDQASESTIRDADMAKEMTSYTKNNVLLQTAQAMLSQANQNPSAVLGLLQNQA